MYHDYHRDQRTKFNANHITATLASQYDFTSITDMVDFLVIMTDIVSFNFMILYCLKYVCCDGDDLTHTMDSDGTSRESNSMSRQPSPRKKEYNRSSREREGERERDRERSKEEGREKDSEVVYDGEHRGVGEGEDDGGEGGEGGETGGYYDSEDSFEGGLNLFSCRHGSDMLSSSCRLQQLPFSIDYSPDKNRLKCCSRLQDHVHDNSNQGKRSGDKERSDGDSKSINKNGEHMVENENRTVVTDSEACEFINLYGSYLDLDLMAVCCSLLEYPMALDAVLLAAGNDVQLDKVSTALGKCNCPVYTLFYLLHEIYLQILHS
jgi:hypothetical protein